MKNEQIPGYPPQSGYPPEEQGYPEQSQSAYPTQPAPTPHPQQGYPTHGYVQQQQPVSSQNTTVVMAGQQPGIVTVQAPYVNDYLGLSIFSCLCCCWILGIIAIVKSCEAQNLNTAGDYSGAMAAANTARSLSIASIICGIVIVVIIIVAAAASAAAN